jgi:hypothetical protein
VFTRQRRDQMESGGGWGSIRDVRENAEPPLRRKEAGVFTTR